MALANAGGFDRAYRTCHPLTSFAASADKIPIAFDVNGTGGRGLVFVHGWSCDRSYWAAQMRHFATTYRVVAVDLAGHGESGVGRGSWTMEAFGRDVAAVVDALGLRDVVLVGHSMGGDVVAEAAVPLRDRVRGLVWVDTYSSLAEITPREEVDAFVDGFRTDFATSVATFVRTMFLPTVEPALVNRVAGDMASAPSEIALDALAHTYGNAGRVIELLAELDLPVVAIQPDYEPTDETSLLEHGVRPVMMTGVSHFAMMEEPTQFNRVLEGVLEDLGFGQA